MNIDFIFTFYIHSFCLDFPLSLHSISQNKSKPFQIVEQFEQFVHCFLLWISHLGHRGFVIIRFLVPVCVVVGCEHFRIIILDKYGSDYDDDEDPRVACPLFV